MQGMEISLCRAKGIYLVANNDTKMTNYIDNSWMVHNMKAKDMKAIRVSKRNRVNETND